MSKLTPAQQFAIDTLDKPLSVVAAAGSGKTTVLVERYLALLKQGHLPESMLALSFTTEAADQLRSRIVEGLEASETASPDLLTQVRHTLKIGTLHSFCYHTLNQFGSLIGLAPISAIQDPFQLAKIFDQHYTLWIESLAAETLSALLKFYPHQQIKALARKAYDFKQIFFYGQLDEEATPFMELSRRAFRPLVQNIDNHFHQKGIYRFDELETLLIKLFEKNRFVCETLSKQFSSIMVDEFQDTSPNQWKILEVLVGENFNKLFVVGDPRQSIYRFRRADLKLYENAVQKIISNGGISHPMETNFRSVPELICHLNRLARPLFDSPSDMLAGLPADANKDTLKVIRYAGGKSRLEAAKTEATLVAKEIKEALEIDPTASLALLFRTSDRMPMYTQALSELALNCRSKATQSLFKTYDVCDLVAYLKAVENPLDDFALSAFLRTPFVDYSPQSLHQLIETRSGSLFETLLRKAPKDLEWFISLVDEGEVRLEHVLMRLFENSQHLPQRFSALLALWKPLQHCLFVSQALENIRAWEKEELLYQDESNSANTTIRAMTVHAAKGLEFDHVFLVDLLRQPPRRTPPFLYAPGESLGLRLQSGRDAVETQAYQRLKELNKAEDIDESKRVLYVAMTRAKKSLRIYIPEEQKLIPKESWAAYLTQD